MAHRLPVQAPVPRVVYYTEPTTTQELVHRTPAEVAARRQAYRAAYAVWAARQAATAERDRKARRFMLGLGAVVGLAVVAGIGLAGWLAYRAISGLDFGVLAVPALVILGAGALVGGHRCITIVQHWH